MKKMPQDEGHRKSGTDRKGRKKGQFYERYIDIEDRWEDRLNTLDFDVRKWWRYRDRGMNTPDFEDIIECFKQKREKFQCNAGLINRQQLIYYFQDQGIYGTSTYLKVLVHYNILQYQEQGDMDQFAFFPETAVKHFSPTLDPELCDLEYWIARAVGSECVSKLEKLDALKRSKKFRQEIKIRGEFTGKKDSEGYFFRCEHHRFKKKEGEEDRPYCNRPEGTECKYSYCGHWYCYMK
jgi:hypothetical protein